MAGADVCGRVSALWHRWVHVAVVGTYGRVWGHVAEVVAGCGGMSWGGGMGSGLYLGWGHVVGVGHVAVCGSMWQGVGSRGRGWRHVTRDRNIWQGMGWGHVAGCRGRWWWYVAGCGLMWPGVVSCGRGGGMSQGLRAYGRGICQKVKDVHCE